ncbi:MAG: fibronectin type III domain-containing protein [Propionicimonas sp.]
MPDPLIGLDPGRASVQPGGQARITVTLTNTGTLVEGYRLQVLGPVAGWSQVDPPEVSVYPQQKASVAVVFSPPSGTGAPAGTHRFRVVARSTLDPKVGAITEGTVDVAKVFGLQAKIVPVTSTGRWRGRHTIDVTNWGNAPAQLRMTASDPDDVLGFYLKPAIISLAPGGRATVRVSARARRPFLRGTPTRLPFEVVGERLDAQPGPPPPGLGYGDPSRPVVSGAFTQKPILSAGLAWLLSLVLAAVVGLGIYLYAQPEPKEEDLSTRGAPARPVLSVTVAGPTSVVARWEPVETADGYELQRFDPVNGGGVAPELPPLGEVTSVEVPNLPPETQVCFRLRASRGGDKGPWSGTVCDTTLAPAQPTAPASTATPTSTWPPRKALPPLRATRGSVTVDGDTGDWQWQQVARANQPIIGATSADGDIYLMWDDQALYLLAVVRDPSLNPPNPSDLRRVYRGDAVILELGSDNRGLSAADLARPTDAYYMVGPATPGAVPTATGWPSFAPTLPSTLSATIGVLGPNAGGTSFETPRDTSLVTAAVKPFGEGYVLEARIPWAASRLNGIEPGATLAANVIVSDRKPDSLANRGMVSTNEQRSLVDLRAHPFYWQQLELLP